MGFEDLTNDLGRDGSAVTPTGQGTGQPPHLGGARQPDDRSGLLRRDPARPGQFVLLGHRRERVDDVLVWDPLEAQLVAQGPARQVAGALPGLDPHLGEVPVVDQVVATGTEEVGVAQVSRPGALVAGT